MADSLRQAVYFVGALLVSLAVMVAPVAAQNQSNTAAQNQSTTKGGIDPVNLSAASSDNSNQDNKDKDKDKEHKKHCKTKPCKENEEDDGED